MSKNKNLFVKFWQELKRRKVFKVIAMYAGTAYVIIQVIELLVEPLKLPLWISTLIIIILSAGFPVVAVLAWIFDLTPEGIKKTGTLEETELRKAETIPSRRRLKASDIVIAVLAIAVIILAYPKIFKRDTLKSLRAKGQIAVAVMPFQNMTNDTTWNVWQDGIQNELITSLSNSEELKVRQTESTKRLLEGKGLTNYASITPAVAGTLSKKLETDVFIYGSIKEAGKSMRVNAQLSDSRTGDIFKSFQIDGIPDNIIFIIDSLSKEVKRFLVVTVLQKSFQYQHLNANSPEALKYFIYGMDAYFKFDFIRAREWLSKAVAIDSNFVGARISLAATYGDFLYNPDVDVNQEKKMVLKLYERRAKMNKTDELDVEGIYAALFQTPVEQIKIARQQLDIDDQNPLANEVLGYLYYQLLQYDKAIPYYKKEFEIYKNWGIKPYWAWCYTNFGDVYHKTGQYKNENKLYKTGLRDFPDSPDIISRQAILALSTGKTKDAKGYIDQYKSILKGNSMSDADILINLAQIYYNAGIHDKAIEYMRQVIALEPENKNGLNILAWFLIDTDKNVNEGLELVTKALELSPDTWYMLDTKGWGLYKQGKYKEAFDLIQKSWNSRTWNDGSTFLHLEATKKAVAGLKNN